MSVCSQCGSGRVATRRSLFIRLMDRQPPPDGFEWYGEAERGAMPPKSLFLQVGLFSLLTLAPLLLLSLSGLVGSHTFYLVGGSAAVLVLAALLVDTLFTFRRYRRWVGESLCADCRISFQKTTDNLTRA